jgi:hypothetical protein
MQGAVRTYAGDVGDHLSVVFLQRFFDSWKGGEIGVSEEIGRTARFAATNWGRTARMCLLLVAIAVAAGAFVAVKNFPLITW